MAKTISAEGLALCAGCEHGTIQNSLVPYCTSNWAPYSSYCKHKPYGSTPYVAGLRQKIKHYQELLDGMDEKDGLAIRLKSDVEVAQRRIELHLRMPKWRIYFIEQGNNK